MTSSGKGGDGVTDRRTSVFSAFGGKRGGGGQGRGGGALDDVLIFLLPVCGAGLGECAADGGSAESQKDRLQRNYLRKRVSSFLKTSLC